MTDKQIMIEGEKLTKVGFINKFSFKLTNADLFERERICSKFFDIIQHKEQECEKAKQNAQDTYDLWQALIESFNILQGEKIKLEQECEELKKAYARLNSLYNDNCDFTGKLEKTLAEIKPILEYYESSNIGEKQEDGSYMLKFTFSDIATPYCIKYDPRPAKEALRKINEVEE